MPFIAMVHRHTFSITLVRDSMDDSVLSVKALLSVLGGDQFGFVAGPGRLFSVKLASVLTARGGFYESQRARLCPTRHRAALLDIQRADMNRAKFELKQN